MSEYNLHQLKILYNTEEAKDRKDILRKLLDDKINQSRQKWFQKHTQKDLFTRMMAEADIIYDNQTSFVEKPFNDITNKKTLGQRHDLV
jgi:hypothetical protein